MVIRTTWDPSTVLCRVRALVAWLAQHGSAVESFTFWFIWFHVPSLSDAVMTELAAVEACCMAACSGAATRLRRLDVSGCLPLATAAWLPGMRALEEARIWREGQELHLPSGFSRLTNLRRLQLGGRRVVPCPNERLPASLTSLELTDYRSADMPPEVG